MFMGLLRMISEQELEISCAVQNSGDFNALILLLIKDKIVAGVEASQISSQFISAPPHFWLTSEKQKFFIEIRQQAVRRPGLSAATYSQISRRSPSASATSRKRMTQPLILSASRRLSSRLISSSRSLRLLSSYSVKSSPSS